MDILIQGIGGVALVANFISFQMKKHYQIMFFRTMNEALFILQYIMLGAFSGATLSAVGCVRNLIFARQVAKNRKTVWSTVLFCIVFTAFGIVTFHGFASVMLIFAKVLSTVAYGNKNTTVVRVVSFITHIAYFIYNFCVFSLAGVIGDTVLLVSLICGIYRFDIRPRINKAA